MSTPPPPLPEKRKAVSDLEEEKERAIKQLRQESTSPSYSPLPHPHSPTFQPLEHRFMMRLLITDDTTDPNSARSNIPGDMFNSQLISLLSVPELIRLRLLNREHGIGSEFTNVLEEHNVAYLAIYGNRFYYLPRGEEGKDNLNPYITLNNWKRYIRGTRFDCPLTQETIDKNINLIWSVSCSIGTTVYDSQLIASNVHRMTNLERVQSHHPYYAHDTDQGPSTSHFAPILFPSKVWWVELFFGDTHEILASTIYNRTNLKYLRISNPGTQAYVIDPCILINNLPNLRILDVGGPESGNPAKWFPMRPRDPVQASRPLDVLIIRGVYPIMLTDTPTYVLAFIADPDSLSTNRGLLRVFSDANYPQKETIHLTINDSTCNELLFQLSQQQREGEPLCTTVQNIIISLSEDRHITSHNRVYIEWIQDIIEKQLFPSLVEFRLDVLRGVRLELTHTSIINNSTRIFVTNDSTPSEHDYRTEVAKALQKKDVPAVAVMEE